MKFRFTLVLLGLLALTFSSCESDKTTPASNPVYKVVYSFSIEQGNYAAVVLKYIDATGQLVTLNDPVLPWTLTINNAQVGQDYYVKSNFNAKPSAVFKCQTQLLFYKDAGLTRNENCNQNFINLTSTVPLSCEGSGTLY